MDASVFSKMLSAPGRLDLKKMGYKYGQQNLQEFLALCKQHFIRNCLCMTLTEILWYAWTRRYKFRCQRLVFC